MNTKKKLSLLLGTAMTVSFATQALADPTTPGGGGFALPPGALTTVGTDPDNCPAPNDGGTSFTTDDAKVLGVDGTATVEAEGDSPGFFVTTTCIQASTSSTYDTAPFEETPFFFFGGFLNDEFATNLQGQTPGSAAYVTVVEDGTATTTQQGVVTENQGFQDDQDSDGFPEVLGPSLSGAFQPTADAVIASYVYEATGTSGNAAMLYTHIEVSDGNGGEDPVVPEGIGSQTVNYQTSGASHFERTTGTSSFDPGTGTFDYTPTAGATADSDLAGNRLHYFDADGNTFDTDQNAFGFDATHHDAGTGTDYYGGFSWDGMQLEDGTNTTQYGLSSIGTDAPTFHIQAGGASYIDVNRDSVVLHGGTSSTTVTVNNSGIGVVDSTNGTTFTLDSSGNGTFLGNVNAVNGNFSGDVSVGDDLSVTDDASIGGDLSVAGNSAVTGNSTVGGTLGVTGATTLGSTLSVAGLTTTNGIANTGNISTTTLGVTNNATVGGTLGVTGATTLGSTLSVAGATTTNGITNTGNISTTTLGVTNNATVGGTLGVTGATTLGSTLSVAGATTTNGITNTGNIATTTLSTTGNASVGGNATVAGTLGVTGHTSLSSVSTSGNAAIGGTLGVTGATTTHGITNTGNISNSGAISTATLSTSGNATIGGTLGVTGATTTNGITNTGNISNSGAISTATLSTSGNATIGGTLGVTGLTSTNGISNTGNISNSGAISTATLSTSGAASVGTNLTVGGTLGVTGATTLTGQLNANGGIVTNNANVNVGTGRINAGTIVINGSNGNKISGLANATLSSTSTEAVTGQQLFATNTALSALDAREAAHYAQLTLDLDSARRRAFQGVAMAMAVDAAPLNLANGEAGISGGVGVFEGEWGAAIRAQGVTSSGVGLGANFGFSSDSVGGAVGASIKF